MLAVHLLRHYTSTAGEIEEVSQGLTRHQVKRVTDFMSSNVILASPHEPIGRIARSEHIFNRMRKNLKDHLVAFAVS